MQSVVRAIIRTGAMLVMVALPTGGIHASEPAAKTTTPGYPAGRIVYHASQSGQPTLDSDAQGGNPFATAFIEALSQRDATLSEFTTRLGKLTKRHSGGFQSIAVSPSVLWPDWSVSPSRKTGKRVALVLVISDYSASQSPSLPGARFDAGRIAMALERAGFDTTRALDLDEPDFRAALAAFRIKSADAEVALIYTTGHGVEIDGRVHLLAGNYPVEQGAAALARHGYPLSWISRAATARSVNLVFYAGCRNNPFLPE
jgi:hypothetical protein